MSQHIHIKGAREHNLKNLDLVIPRDRLVVITGLSGSGKSSLAFDTIYAEGQRRYVESLSAYARQFLEQMGKPDVDSIEGLSPAISIEQKRTSHNPRSTVGTVTEIYDYLRLLFARIGRPFCVNCGEPITAQTVQQMVDAIGALPVGSKFQLLAPIVAGAERRISQGVSRGSARRLRAGPGLMERLSTLGSPISLEKQRKHTIEIIVDRLIMNDEESLRRRLGGFSGDGLEIESRLGGDSDGRRYAHAL